jgi:hypothetical protein
MSDDMRELSDYSAALTAEEKVNLINDIIILPLPADTQRALVALIIESGQYR